MPRYNPPIGANKTLEPPLAPMADSNSFAQTYRRARREALIVALVWLLSLLWTVGYCYLYGYRHTADSLAVQLGLVEPWRPEHYRQIWGMPDWAMFGIFVPWLICSVFTVFYGLFGISDDPLGPEGSEGGGHGA